MNGTDKYCVIQPPAFDHDDHFSSQRKNPEAFMKLSDLTAYILAVRPVRMANTMEGLRIAFRTGAKQIKDKDLLEMFTAAKDKRKLELSKNHNAPAGSGIACEEKTSCGINASPSQPAS